MLYVYVSLSAKKIVYILIVGNVFCIYQSVNTEKSECK